MWPLVKPAYAQITNTAVPWMAGKDSGTIIGGLISSLAGIALIVAGLITFGYLVMGGIQWITSGGDKGGLEAARNKIIHAIVGLVIVASTWALISLVFSWLGMCFPNINIPVVNQVAAQPCHQPTQYPVPPTPAPRPPTAVPPRASATPIRLSTATNTPVPPAPTTNTAWYGCAQGSIIVGTCDACDGQTRTCNFSCQPNGCTARETGSCGSFNNGSGTCPLNCLWRASVAC